MVRIPAAIAKRIDNHLAKYMRILDVADKPSIEVHDDPQSFWYGRTSPKIEINSKTRELLDIKTTIDLQKRILKNDPVLERVIAHEMVHYRDWLTPEKRAEAAKAIASVSAGVPSGYRRAQDEDEPSEKADDKAHGPSFHEGAARINAVMGPGFVTQYADDWSAGLDPVRRRVSPVVVLGIGGLALLTGMLMVRRLRAAKSSQTPTSVPPRGTQPARPPRVNERGHYGNK